MLKFPTYIRSIQSLSEQLRCVSLYGGVPYPPQVGKEGEGEGGRTPRREGDNRDILYVYIERERVGGEGGGGRREGGRRV